MSVYHHSFIVTPFTDVAVLKTVKATSYDVRIRPPVGRWSGRRRRLMAVTAADEVMRSHESNSVFGYAQSIQIASDFNR